MNTKHLPLTLSLACGLALAVSAYAIDVASTPVGITRTDLPAGTVSLLAIDLVQPVEFTGNATVSGKTLTFTGTDVSAFWRRHLFRGNLRFRQQRGARRRECHHRERDHHDPDPGHRR